MIVLLRNSFIIFLVLAFFSSFKSVADESPYEITLAYGLENYNFAPLFDEFRSQTGIEIKVTTFANNELKAELILSASTQQLPDAVIVPSDFTGLDDINVSNIPQRLFSASTKKEAIESTKVDGLSKGIPIVYGNHLVLFYNKNLVSQPADNWSEILEHGKSLKDGIELISWSYLEMYWFIPFLGTFNGLPYVDNKVKLSTPEMVEALKWYGNLSKDKVVDQNCDYQCAKDKFISGKLAYTINGSWAYGDFKEELGDKLGVALLPKLGKERMKPYFSSHVLAFPNNSLQGENSAKLERLANFFQTEKAQLMLWNTMNSIPTNRKTLAYLQSKNDENLNVMLQQLEFSKPMPNDREMAIVWEAMLKGTNRYLADVFDAESAANYMQYIAEKSIQHARKQ